MTSQAVEIPRVQERTSAALLSTGFWRTHPAESVPAQWEALVGETKGARAEPRDMGPQAQVDEPLCPREEVYSLGSRAGRIIGACIGLAIVLAPGFIFHPPGAIFHPGAVLGAMLFGLPLAILFASLEALDTPYEVRIAPSGEIRFASVLGATDISATDIVGIVRRERRSDRKVDCLSIRYGTYGGSVTLHGNEEIFARLTALRPTMLIRTEVYDDTD